MVRYESAEMARRGRLGALASHGRHDARELTKNARAAFRARFEDDAARRAHYSRMAAASAAVRQAKQQAESAATAQQPRPTGDGAAITPLVMRDLVERSVTGQLKYGTALRAGNGRDALTDAYQEALDLVQYLRQVLYERDGK
jgi:hypothetical protein